MKRELMAVATLMAGLTAHAKPDCIGPAHLATCKNPDGSIRTVVRLRYSEVVQQHVNGGTGASHITTVLHGGAVIYQRGTTADGSVWWKTITPGSWSDESGRWHQRTDGARANPM